MTNWPQDYSAAWTLASQPGRTGIGLHHGQESVVELRPSERPGFHLSVDGDVPIRLRPDQVLDSPLCTTLVLGERRVATVEHLLAALAGCGLSHVEISVSGGEVPLLDGSALGWVEAIAEVGLQPAATPRSAAPTLEAPLVRHRGSSVITATPAETFSLVGIIDFPQPAIGRQQLAIELTPQRFVEEIAPARTFGTTPRASLSAAVTLASVGSAPPSDDSRTATTR